MNKMLAGGSPAGRALKAGGGRLGGRPGDRSDRVWALRAHGKGDRGYGGVGILVPTNYFVGIGSGFGYTQNDLLVPEYSQPIPLSDGEQAKKEIGHGTPLPHPPRYPLERSCYSGKLAIPLVILHPPKVDEVAIHSYRPVVQPERAEAYQQAFNQGNPELTYPGEMTVQDSATIIRRHRVKWL